jgi:ABC-type dipeptide/oligopeptide/nickel transport system permease component
MPKMNLSHFEATILLALLISIVMGITTKRTDRDRLKYGLRCFLYFLVAVFGLGWLMHFGHG